jgi:hypothetical protein
VNLTIGLHAVVNNSILVAKPVPNDLSLLTFWFEGVSRDSSGSIALGYGLNDRGSRVRFPAADGNFSLHHRVQNGSGAHPTSYPLCTRVSFPGGKAAGA